MANTSIPEFGTSISGVPLVDRPGAYAIIQDKLGRIAVIRTERGCFLPGGGMDPGETPEQACQREALEECGWEIRLIAILGQAIDIFYMESRNLCYRIQGTYFTAEITHELPKSLIPHPPDEPAHTLLWLSPQEVLPLFVRPGHAWAIRRMKAEG